MTISNNKPALMNHQILDIINFICSLYPGRNPIALHEPSFDPQDKAYVVDAIESTYVSSVGKYVDQLERMICDYTGSCYAIAMVNGTSALHIALLLSGVNPGDEVITQPVSFVATANAISYCGARPVFLDVDRRTLSLDPVLLENFLKESVRISDNSCYNKITGNRIAACLPMHTFGHPAQIDKIAAVCRKYHIQLVEDAAESIGSLYKGKHTGTFGLCGVFSFNGNKTITCGGGGVLVTDDKELARQAKHLSTTAKRPHPFEYCHDEIGYNYRLPNLNAALACSQLLKLDSYIEKKRTTARRYIRFFESLGIPVIIEPEGARSNYWLNTIILPSKESRDRFLEQTNNAGILTRPIWRLLNELEMYQDCYCSALPNAKWAEERIVNIPSSIRISI